MTHPAFFLERREMISALNITVEFYRHVQTKARHLHLVAQDSNNAFLVAFLTIPTDSTGIAHILEHTALCGSERYPVRDPFFMMLRRSLSTFMNAFTSSDWTAYPFASQSRKDFDNLLRIYLDAAFFPRLDELDFAQEGWRVEFARPEDPTSELVYKGIVFNEMKGALSSPARLLWDRLSHHLFPTITYHYNSGGDPESIPDLTWEDLKAFHARHYHPSNAIFMTYGNIPAAEHQAKFEELALCRFSALDIHFFVPDEQRRTTPLQIEESYPLSQEEMQEGGKTHVVFGWLWGQSTGDLETLLEAHLLNGVLLDNSSSPLLRALETTSLGSSPSPICGLDDSSREMVFACGLEGSEPEHADAVEALIFQVLKQVAEEGVEQSRVESVLHQLELSRREIGGDGYPYGLKLMLNALTPALHNGDPVAALALDSALENLRLKIADPEFIKTLTRTWLLDNPHRVRLTFKPDSELSAQTQAREAARLAALKEGLDSQRTAEIIARTVALKQRQESEDDPEILPKLTLADVPDHPAIPQRTLDTHDHVTLSWYDQPTNGLVYQQFILELPDLEESLVDLLPLFSSFLTEVGCGERDYLTIQALQSAISGGIHARSYCRGAIDDPMGFLGVFSLTGKALTRNHRPFTELLRDTLTTARFDERTRLRELVAQTRAMAELKITDNGHALAMSAATRSLSPCAAFSERWGGMTAIQRLRKLDQSLDNEEKLTEFIHKLEQLREKILSNSGQLVVIGEKKHFADFTDHLKTLWPTHSIAQTQPTLATPSLEERVQLGWATTTQVHFCAKAYPGVPFAHPDAAALSVLGTFLKNGYLHRAIREQGGAYGGGAGMDTDARAFRFYSYRDPRLLETLNDFDRSLDWLAETRHEPRTLEEAILGVIGPLDRPGSPAGEATRAFNDIYHGKTPEIRHRFRDQLLATSLHDLHRVADTYLRPELGHIAVVSNLSALTQHKELGLEIRNL
ncbi:MAG: insulinase family protein [Magnetococcus sp. DMHC-6]